MDSGGKAEKAWCFSNPCLSDWIFNDKYTQLTNKTQQECFFRHGSKQENENKPWKIPAN